MREDALRVLRERAAAGDFEAWERLLSHARRAGDLDLYDDLIRDQMFGEHASPATFARLISVLVRDGERDMAVELTGELVMMHGEAMMESAAEKLAEDDAGVEVIAEGLARFRRARDHGQRG